MKNENKEIFDYLNKVYSKSKIVDYVKFLYQAYIGPSHYKSDEKGIIEAFEKEKFNLKPKQTDLYIENIGNNFVRVSFSKVLDKGLSILTYVRLFILSRDSVKPNFKLFKESLCDLRTAIEIGLVDFDLTDYDNFIKKFELEGYPSLSHSDKYKSIYNPHYLLYTKEISKYLPIFMKIDELILDNEDINSYLNTLDKLTYSFLMKNWKYIYPEIKL